MLSEDDFFQEFLITLSKYNVQYLILGGFAVNLYGFTRVTEDLDIWVDPSDANMQQFKKAVLDLKFPEEQSLKSFLNGNTIMIRLADDNFKVDILTKINIRKTFSEAFKNCQVVEMPYGKIFFLGYEDLIDEKLRAKRPKDIIDIDQLRTIRGEWNSKKED